MLERTFGCCRYIYNWALRERIDAYYQRHERWYYAQMSSALTLLKKRPDTAWLNESSSIPPQQALRHLDKAFLNFFVGRAKYPTFKKKHGIPSAKYTASGFRWNGTALALAKMDAPLDIHWSRLLPEGSKPTTVTVSRDKANRYFVSILIEEDIKPLPVVNKQVGIDLGLKSMVITSDGDAYGNPKFFAKDEKNLAKAQRRLTKKTKGSKNSEKARLKVARIHARIADRRRDYQHKLSTHIIGENQIIYVESLTVKNMVKNHSLAKAITDVGWGEFVRQLEYKAQWYGRTLVKVDRWYPSSKRCFDCGHILVSLPLDIRIWTCPQCGVVHDRDINAAKNMVAAGQAVLASGESVRPGRAKAHTGKTH